MGLPDRQRLEKLLGMLGSSFDGERANAARMISALAERHKLTISELVFGSRNARSAASARPAASTRERAPMSKSRATLQALADIAATESAWEFTLTDWECQFARDVSTRYGSDYELSEKQLAIAERIIHKVGLAREKGVGA